MGIFLIWIPTVLVAKQCVGSRRRKDFWQRVLKGSPEWMRYMVYGFFAYAMVNFALSMLKAPAGGAGTNPPAEVWRGFSGHGCFSILLRSPFCIQRRMKTPAGCVA